MELDYSKLSVFIIISKAKIREFIALCAGADFDSHYADDIEQVLWDKWVFLAALAGMTTLCQGSVGEIVATPYGADLARKLELLEQKYNGKFRVVFDAIRLLMAPGVAAERKRIGF